MSVTTILNSIPKRKKKQNKTGVFIEVEKTKIIMDKVGNKKRLKKIFLKTQLFYVRKGGRLN